MTGAEHYKLAEDCLRSMADEGDTQLGMVLLAEAQVHATLALAAATALRDPEGGTLGTRNHDTWLRAASA